MQSRAAREPANVHHARAIQIKTNDGCSSGGSEANHFCEALIPGEMLMPAILPGMEKHCERFRDGVFGLYGCVFGAITTLTREGEVIQFV